MKLKYALVIAGALMVAMSLSVTSNFTEAQEVNEDVLERGQYIATIAGCESCHTPLLPVYDDLAAASFEDIQTLALFEHNALDDERPYAGGRAFSLGPQGVVFASNLTPDEETGIGEWSTEELKFAIQTGVRPDGTQMHPLMPYRLYISMADADLEALVAFLQSIEPVENEVPDSGILLPPFGLEPPAEPIVVPDVEDIEAYSNYLMNAILPCTECHTPLDAETGQPVLDLYMAGGQPFEGPWGIVYGSNITPHESGIADYSEDDLARLITSGVRPDGRRVILMPWGDYTGLTEEDLRAAIYFFQNTVEAVENDVPNASLQEGFEVVVELPE